MPRRIIKKYPNRRLYDTVKSGYITIADVLKLVRDGDDFQVVDSETGEDLTRSVLVQIILEQESGATPIFTTEMLTKFIRFYDEASHNVFGEFLDRSMKMFIDQQKRFQDQLGTAAPLQVMQEMTERNFALWQDMQQRFLDVALGKKDVDSPPSKKKKT